MKRLADDADARHRLQTSQRAWIAFRDAECAFATANTAGGSIHPMMVAGCLQGLTEARAATSSTAISTARKEIWVAPFRASSACSMTGTATA